MARHLMQRRRPIIRGLASRSPFFGIDGDTLEGLYGEAAAKIAALASAGRRGEWRSTRDLERAVIAAFRYEAQKHWRSMKTDKRRADRDALSFDPLLHDRSEDTLQRILFDGDPRYELVARDWLVQLRPEIRTFWSAVIVDGLGFKDAGDRLSLSKPERQARVREGIEQLGRFRSLHEDGRICQLRQSAIVRYLHGDATAADRERARAHLDCCLACALVYEANASALTRGILHLLPLPGIGRALARLRDVVGDRSAEAIGGAGAAGAAGGGGALLFGGGAGTAALCVGAISWCAGVTPLQSPFHHQRPPQHERTVAAATHAPATPSQTTTIAAPALPTSTTSSTAGTSASDPQDRPRASVSEFGGLQRPQHKPKKRSSQPATTEQVREFDAESQAATAPASTLTASTASTSSSTTSSSPTTSSGSSTSSSSSTAAVTEFGSP